MKLCAPFILTNMSNTTLVCSETKMAQPSKTFFAGDEHILDGHVDVFDTKVENSIMNARL